MTGISAEAQAIFQEIDDFVMAHSPQQNNSKKKANQRQPAGNSPLRRSPRGKTPQQGAPVYEDSARRGKGDNAAKALDFTSAVNQIGEPGNSDATPTTSHDTKTTSTNDKLHPMSPKKKKQSALAGDSTVQIRPQPQSQLVLTPTPGTVQPEIISRKQPISRKTVTTTPPDDTSGPPRTKNDQSSKRPVALATKAKPQTASTTPASKLSARNPESAETAPVKSPVKLVEINRNNDNDKRIKKKPTKPTPSSPPLPSTKTKTKARQVMNLVEKLGVSSVIRQQNDDLGDTSDDNDNDNNNLSTDPWQSRESSRQSPIGWQDSKTATAATQRGKRSIPSQASKPTVAKKPTTTSITTNTETVTKAKQPRSKPTKPPPSKRCKKTPIPAMGGPDTSTVSQPKKTPFRHALSSSEYEDASDSTSDNENNNSISSSSSNSNSNKSGHSPNTHNHNNKKVPSKSEDPEEAATDDEDTSSSGDESSGDDDDGGDETSTSSTGSSYEDESSGSEDDEGSDKGSAAEDDEAGHSSDASVEEVVGKKAEDETPGHGSQDSEEGDPMDVTQSEIDSLREGQETFLKQPIPGQSPSKIRTKRDYNTRKLQNALNYYAHSTGMRRNATFDGKMEHMRGKFWKDVFGEFAVSDEDWERDLESFDFATFSKNMDDLNMFGLPSAVQLHFKLEMLNRLSVMGMDFLLRSDNCGSKRKSQRALAAYFDNLGRTITDLQAQLSDQLNNKYCEILSTF